MVGEREGEQASVIEKKILFIYNRQCIAYANLASIKCGTHVINYNRIYHKKKSEVNRIAHELQITNKRHWQWINE